MSGMACSIVLVALVTILAAPSGLTTAWDLVEGGPVTGPTGPGDDPPTRLLNANYVPAASAPTVDGVAAAGEWDAAEGTSALWSERPPAWEETGAHISGPGIQGDADASHLFWAMYDADWLYLLFNCTDDAIHVDSYPSAFWRDDSIEVCIDGAHDMDPNQRIDEGYEDGDTFNVPADGRDGLSYSYANANVHSREWGPMADWYSAVTNRTTYYVIEVAIRLASVASPRPGDTLGLNTGQNDDDDGGLTKEGVIRWTGVDGVPVWSNESVWGDLHLRTAVVADAGVDAEVDQGARDVLDGSGSWGNHPDFATTAVYNWTFQYDGREVSLAGAAPAFTFDVPGSYAVTLNVTDAAGVRDADTVAVVVRDMEAPVARAGDDATIDQGATHTFDGSLSTDNDPAHPAGFDLTWTLLDGAPVILHGQGPSHTFESPGAFLVELNVTDRAGNFGLDSVLITVRDTGPPVARAGPDLEVDEDQEVELNGTASSDNVGIATYAWGLEVDGVPVVIVGPVVVHTFTEPGIYEVTLTVTDGSGHSGTDALIVIVRDVTVPVADAGGGADVVEDVAVTLDGTASTDNVGIASYAWTVARDGTVVDSLEGADPSYVFHEPGVYTVTLLVLDGVGLSSTDTATYTVLDTTGPEADAGGDRTVDEDVSITLDGTSSTDNVGIASYNWTIVMGSDIITTLEGPSPAHTFAEPGVYTVTMVAKDAADNQGNATITVAVRDTTPPLPHGWATVKVKVGEVANFNGIASSDNVGIVLFVWTITSKGGFKRIEGANITHTFDAAGSYNVTLTVADAAGNNESTWWHVDVVRPKKDDGPGPVAWMAATALVAVAVTARRRR